LGAWYVWTFAGIKGLKWACIASYSARAGAVLFLSEIDSKTYFIPWRRSPLACGRADLADFCRASRMGVLDLFALASQLT